MSDPNSLPPLPANHLDHPEKWATGADPATEKQKGFIAVLEKQNPGLIPEEGIDENNLGKSEASEIIDSLKKGEKIDESHNHSNDSNNDNDDVNIEKQTLDQDQTETEIKEPSTNQLSKNTTTKPVVEEKEEKEEKTGDKRKEPPSSKETSDGGDRKEQDPSSKETTKTSKKDNQDQDEDGDIELEGKDTKESKQTTLDGAFDKDNQDASKDTSKAEEDKEGEDRASKKAKLDSSSTPTEIKSSKTNTTSKTSTSSNGAGYKGGYNEDHPPIQTDSGATYPKPTETEDTIPGSPSHLDHPENWATGDDPATDKQKGFIKVLEKQKGVSEVGNVDSLGKSEASEKIEELKEM
ncbi:uncharacterized protein L201_005118 [Kwoniella dendrophila CBS 6074]|uniref:Hypervirulence associated protein TUDOR domain-containing protein n=1 Tax=Kwoniella dendrophila CBS 6074 TaxID=1295534 RepID=A0AAX4K087_9TREE